ncbi:MAG: TlyA family RNA methyltransferase [Pseudomonadota bacterium]
MQRLDQRMVALGLVESRARAQALIAESAVTVDGAVATKPAQKVADAAMIALVADPLPWVSRAALKLVHALDLFDLTPSGLALDLGASTGGFTEVLLARGASRVIALDVGQDQLHPRVAADLRVTRLDGVNARALPPDLPPPDWITADLSFISLTKALPAALDHAQPGATLVALIKPQFELGPGAAPKGVVKDPALHARARAEIADFLATAGWEVTGEAESPITGSDGNREFLIAARKPR